MEKNFEADMLLKLLEPRYLRSSDLGWLGNGFKFKAMGRCSHLSK